MFEGGFSGKIHNRTEQGLVLAGLVLVWTQSPVPRLRFCRRCLRGLTGLYGVVAVTNSG